jgi:hypothetical protein
MRWLTLLSLLCFGCANRLTPPQELIEPVTVHVVDHGRHSSLLLPDGRGGTAMYSFGEWRAFALNRNTWHDYARALFGGHGTLGRASFATTEPNRLQQYIGGELIPLRVERTEAELLLMRLAVSWEVRAAEAVDNRRVGLRLVPYTPPGGLYWGLNNCNHATSRWLRSLSVDAPKAAVFSNWTTK